MRIKILDDFKQPITKINGCVKDCEKAMKEVYKKFL